MSISESNFVSRLSGTDYSADKFLKAVGALRGKWQALPRQIRRKLCIKYLDQPASDKLLPLFRRMAEASDFDIRLIAVCVKLYCEKQLYPDAYRVLEHCLLQRSREIMRQGAIVKADFRPYLSDVKHLENLWQYVDIQSRKDTAARHQSADQLNQLLTILIQDYENLLRDLPLVARSKLIVALLGLAKMTGAKQYIDQIYQLAVRAGLQDDLVIYTRLMEQLTRRTVFLKNDFDWEWHLSDFKRRIERDLPDEAACWRALYNDQLSTGKNDKAGRGKRLNMLLSALELSGSADLARRFARQILDRQPAEINDFYPSLLRCLNDSIRVMAAQKLRSLHADRLYAGGNLNLLIPSFLLLNDRDSLAALGTRGLLDGHRFLSCKDVADIYSMLGDFDLAIAKVAQMRSDSLHTFAAEGDQHSLGVLSKSRVILDNLRFLKACSDILNEVPQPSSPQGIVIVVAKDASELNLFPILALRELKQRGLAIVPLMAGIMEYQPTGIPEIDQIAGRLAPGMNFSQWQENAAPDSRDNWASDYQARKILYNDVDVYWGVREYLNCRYRRYSIDFNSAGAREALDVTKCWIEAFESCIRNISEIGKRLSLPVKFLVSYIHLGAPYYLRQHVQKLAASQDIAVVQVANAYENYFANFGAEMSSTVAVRNMTEHSELTAAYYPPVSHFNRHYHELADKERQLDEVMQWIRQNRIQRKGGIENPQRLDFLRAERKQGKKIVGLFGKVLFDLGMLRGDGPAHMDMRDWFDHTVAIASENDHLHLVIKPHPHEIRDEIALYPTEFLKEWLPAAVPANVHFLGHDELNLFELADVLDLALLWNGTSALELGVLGVPTIMGAYYGVIDYPVGHILPQSRYHYEEMIVSREKLTVPKEVKLRSAALINYFRHPDVSIAYRYTRRTLTNRSVRELHWFEEDLQAFYAHGDPNVARIADRIAAIKQAA